MPCYYPYYHVFSCAISMHTRPVPVMPVSPLLFSLHARGANAASQVGFHPDRCLSLLPSRQRLKTSSRHAFPAPAPTRSLLHVVRDGKSDKTFSEVAAAALCRNFIFTCFFFPAKCVFSVPAGILHKSSAPSMPFIRLMIMYMREELRGRVLLRIFCLSAECFLLYLCRRRPSSV